MSQTYQVTALFDPPSDLHNIFSEIVTLKYIYIYMFLNTKKSCLLSASGCCAWFRSVLVIHLNRENKWAVLAYTPWSWECESLRMEKCDWLWQNYNLRTELTTFFYTTWTKTSNSQNPVTKRENNKTKNYIIFMRHLKSADVMSTVQ